MLFSLLLALVQEEWGQQGEKGEPPLLAWGWPVFGLLTSPTADELIAFCKERLAPYKVPRQVEFRSELPKTMVGKHSKKELRAERAAKSQSA